MTEPYYQDKMVTIYHGDCAEIVPELGRFDLLLTDPPYGIGANRMTLGNGKRTVYRGEHDWDESAPDLSFLVALGIPSVFWGGNYFHLPLSRRWLVWDKGTGDNDYADCELAWTNTDGVVKKYFRSWVGVNAKEAGEGDRCHPTQKPVSLMEWCIKIVAPKCESILDPFMGSGTTLVAARRNGIRSVGIDREEKYCEIAAQRISQMSLFE